MENKNKKKTTKKQDNTGKAGHEYVNHETGNKRKSEDRLKD